MAKNVNGGKIEYSIGLKIDESGFKQLKAELQEIQKMKTPQAESLGISKSELTQIKSRAHEVEVALSAAFNPKLNTTNIDTFNKKLEGSGLTLKQVYADWSRLGTTGTNAFRSLANELTKSNYELKQSNTLLDKMATTLANTIKWNIASNAINSMTRSIEQAWGYTKSLDGSLNDIRIVTGKSADEMARFAVVANDTAKVLGKTTTDYTKASLIYAQQGLSDKEVQERARITLMAANVTGQSSDEVSEQLTSVWNGYKVTANEAEVYVDRLAKIAANTASNLEELSTGMSKVASAAHAMGVSEGQLAAQISTIISATRQAPESVGTALRTVYARISDIKAGVDEEGVSLGNYSQKMADLGIHVLDVNGKLRDMGSVMEEIGGKWADMTREQQVSLAQTMAGQRQYSNLVALFDNFDKYQEALDYANEAQGTLQEQQDIYMEGLNAHLQVLSTSLDDIYDSLLDIGTTDSIKNLVDMLAKGATAAATLIDNLGGGKQILGMLASVAPLLFTTQITKGIQSQVYNRGIANQKKESFANSTKTISEILSNEELDEDTRRLMNDKEKMYHFADIMPKEQLESLTQAEDKIKDLTNQVEEYNDKVEEGQKHWEAFLGLYGNEEEFKGFEKNIVDVEAQDLEDAVDDYKARLQEEQKNIENQLLDESPMYRGIAKAIQKRKQELEEATDKIGDFSKTEIKDRIASGKYNPKIDATLEKILSQTDEGKDFWDKILEETKSDKKHGKSDWQKRQIEALAKIEELYLKANGIDAKSIEEYYVKQEDKLEKTHQERIRNLEKRRNEISGILADFEPETENSAYNVIGKDDIDEVNQELNKILAERGSLIESVKKSFEDIDFSTAIQDITQFAGGIGSIYIGLSQIKSLGSIWADNDLSAWEKITQSASVLAISLPLIVTGLKTLKTAVPAIIAHLDNFNEASARAFANFVNNAKGSFKDAVEKIKNGIKSINKETVKTAKETVKAALTSSAAMTAYAGVLLTVVAAVAIYGAYVDKMRQQTIEASKAQIEENKEKIKEVETNAEIYRSLGQLNQQRENGTITLSQMKDGIADLVDKYGEEKISLEELNKVLLKNKDIRGYVLDKEIENAEEIKRLTGENQKNAEIAAIKTAHGSFWERVLGNGKNYTNDIVNSFAYSGGSIGDEGALDELIQEKFDTSGEMGYGRYVRFEYSAEGIQEYYDKLIEIRKAYEDWSSEQRAAAELDDWVEAEIAKYESYVEEIRNDNKEIEKQELITKGKEIEKSGVANFGSINDLESYLENRNQLIQSYREKGYTAAVKAANDYLELEHKELSDEYAFYATYADDVAAEFDLEDSAEIANTISQLDLDQLRYLSTYFDLDESNIQDWETLKKIIEEVLNLDFSKKDLMEEASEQYDKYSTLKDQINSSKKKTISKKEFEGLDESVQGLFTQQANGQYKMTATQEQFNRITDNLSLAGFENNREVASERIRNIENYRNKMPDTQSVSYAVDSKLNYLDMIGYDTKQVSAWKMANSLDGVGLDDTQLQAIHDAYLENLNDSINFDEELEKQIQLFKEADLAIARSAETYKDLDKMYENGEISLESYNNAWLELDQSLDTSTLNYDELKDYSEYLQEAADNVDNLDDGLKDNEKAAEIVAKGIMKMNDAIETLSNNWENWSDILKNSSKDSEEYSKALKSTKTIVAQLLDISETRVSDDFLVKPETLDLITEAATGSETAIDSLKDALHQSIVEDLALELEVDKDAFLQSVADLESQIPNLKTTVEVGTELSAINEEAFIESANKLIEDSKMTVEQAQAYFDSLGYEPTFVTEDQVITSQKPTIRTSTRDLGTHWVDTGIDHNGQKTGYMATEKEEYSYISGYTPVEEHILVPALSSKGTPQIKSLTKKATGASNNFSSTNAGGGAPGKGSGKSGSSSKPSQKDHEKPIEDDRDIYHDINIEIEQATRNLERVQKIQERLFGKDLINNLNEQIALIDKQKEKLLEKQEIQKWDLANQQKELNLLGVTFDEYNNIANYMQILAEGQQKVNDATAEYNNLVDAYNAKGTKDEQEGLEASLDAAKEKLQNATDAYKKLEDKIKNYDQLTVDMADLVDELTEATQQQVEIRITKFRMNVQTRLDMGEAQRDWNNFKRNVLYKTDILKDTNFDKIFKDAIKDLQDAISYFNVNGSVGSLQALTDQIVRTRKEIEDIDKTGTSAIYGDNKAKAMEDLQNDLKELMSQMESIEELINSIDQAYLDTMEDISDQFNKQIEDYEFINELLQHDMNLLTLLYGEKNFDAMNNYYTQLEANNLKQLDSLKQQAEFWKERWLAAGDDIQAAAMFEEKYKETIKNLNSLIEESAKTLQDKYTNAITGIFDALDKRVSDGKGTDYLSTEWDLINKHADEYLDTINTAFAIQETESKYNKAINDTQSVKNQQALKKLQNEQLEILKNKEKVTQYDVDRAEKLLQVEQARIALEEAQNAKTSMRLKRDSQGNYSYEYVADDNDIAEAQDALNSAMNDLYNFDKAAYKANLNELLGAWKEFETELAAVLTDSALSEEERTEKVALLKQRYGERINFLTEDNLNIRQNLTESAFADLAQLYDKDVESYENMADVEKTAFLESIIPIWQSGIGKMADEITKEGGFEATCKDAFKEIEDAASKYTDSLKTMAAAAGANFDNVKQGIDPLATELEKLITPTNELMNKVEKQEEKIKSLRLEVQGLKTDWGDVYDAAKKAVSETNEYILAQQEQAAQEAQAAQSGTGDNSGAGSVNGAGTGSGAGSTGSGSSGVDTGSGAGVSAAAASAELIDGIVGNIMQGENTWGWGDERIANITSKFGREVAEAVQGKINREWPNVSLLHGYDPEFYKRYSMSNFRSGGYTGDWAGREGRLALLHQKELVLNQQDTSNLLDAVETLRTVMSSMNGTFAARANDIRNGLGNLFTNNEAIEQNVHIDASFPNVNSKKEIEEAFAELVNLAAQRVMKN